jgi:hypothetical protein
MREREITPLQGEAVPSIVGMPVRVVSHRSRWLYVGAGAAFAIAAAACVLVLSRNSPKKVPRAAMLAQASVAASAPIAKAESAPSPSAPAPSAPAPAVLAPSAPTPAVDQLPVAEPAEPAKKAALPKAHAMHVTNRLPAAPRKSEATSAALPAPPANPRAVNPRDELDQLLASSGADDTRGKAAEPVADDRTLPEAPSREAIAAAIGKLKGRVQDCYDKYQQSGVATVELAIAKTGKVQNAKVTGKFADSDTGRCVSTVVKTGNFPRFKGPILKIDYPFLLQAQ